MSDASLEAILEQLRRLTYLVEQQGLAIDSLLAHAANQSTYLMVLQQRVGRVEALSNPPPTMPTPPAPRHLRTRRRVGR